MKKLYFLHILSLILLLLMGYYFITELRNILEPPIVAEGQITDWEIIRHRIRSKLITRAYAVCSLFVFAFSVFVGWKTLTRLKELGLGLMVGGAGFFIWAIFMTKSPSQISIHEVFPAWVIYIILTICLSIYGRLNYEKAIDLRIYHEDEILDDEMNA